MVGDGINDAPALMQADIGIAIGAGTDIAIESSDVILVGDRLSAVVDAWEVGRGSYRRTKQNLAIAFLFNGIGVPAASTGLVHPVWAMAAMATLVTMVLLNSFGLRMFRRSSYRRFADPAPRREEQRDQPARLTLHVTGVHCDSCMERATAGVHDLAGVIEATPTCPPRRPRHRVPTGQDRPHRHRRAPRAARLRHPRQGLGVMSNTTASPQSDGDDFATRLHPWWVPWLIAAIVAVAVVGSFVAHGRDIDVASMDTSMGMGDDDHAVPPVLGFYDGDEIRFIHTEASDEQVADMLTEMMDSPVIVVPSLADVPSSALGDVFVFANGVRPDDEQGPFGFQPDVFDSVPGDAGYSPLRAVNVVTWQNEGDARVLRSVTEIEDAEAAGELTIAQPGIVVNMPIIKWPGGSRYCRAVRHRPGEHAARPLPADSLLAFLEAL